MSHAWNACGSHIPQGFKSPILRHWEIPVHRYHAVNRDFSHSASSACAGVGVDRPSMRADGRFEGVRLKSFEQPPLLELGGLEAVFFEPLHVRWGVHAPFRAGKQESFFHLGLAIATIT